MKNTIRKNSHRICEAITRLDPAKTPNSASLDIFLRKSGYRLESVTKEDVLDLEITPIRGAAAHTPSILYDPTKKMFFIEFKAYGELDPADSKDLIEAYQKAYGVVEYLLKINLDSLEEI